MGTNASHSSSKSSSGTTPEQMMKNVKRFVPNYSQIVLDQLDKMVGGIGSSGLTAIKETGGDVANAVNNIVEKVNPFSAIAQKLIGKGEQSAEKSGNAADYANEMAAGAVDAAKKGVDAINLKGLSPGEAAAAERAFANNQSATGNLGLLNPMNVLASAMNFGRAYDDKLGLYNNAVGNLTNATAGATAAANASQGISGQFANLGGTANTAGANKTNALTEMNGIVNPATAALGGTLGMMGQLGQVAAGTRSDSKSGSTSAGVQACCFIFMEAYHGTMPTSVRRFRDRYYRLRPDIATGYIKMAQWLVPLMQKYKFIRSLVWATMIKPATEHSKKPQHNWNKKISHFWLRFWSFYGKF